MATDRIALIGQVTSRGHAPTSFSKDQSFRGVVPRVTKNPVTGKMTVGVMKRSAVASSLTTSSGTRPTAIWASPSTGNAVMAFGSTTSTIYAGNLSATDAGSLDTGYLVRHITETIISGVTYYLISATNGTTSAGWYLASDAYSQTSYTGDRTAGSPVINNIASTAGMYSGQPITGTGIPASTYILTVDSSTQITLTQNASSGAPTSTVLTKTPVAKILDADFPTTAVGQFVELDGYIFIMDANGKIWNSDLNTVTAWSATGFISANMFTDGGVGLGRYGREVLAFGTTSTEFFFNKGNPTGSPLERTGRVLPIGSVQYGSGARASAISSEAPLFVWGTKQSEVWMMAGDSPKKISTPAVEAILRGVGSGFEYTLHSFKLWGMAVVHVPAQLGGATFISFLYFPELDIWLDANFWTTLMIADSRATSNVYAVAPLTNSAFYILSGSDNYTENSAPISSVVQTSKIDHGTDKRKFVHEIRLIANNESSGTVTLECSDDDYGGSWTTLGTFDLTAQVKKIVRCGSYTGGRAYRLTHATAQKFFWEALDITYSKAS